MRIAICDDIVVQTDIISTFLRTYQNERPCGTPYETVVYNSPKELADAIKAGQRFDLLLLDIIMPQMDGISLAQLAREHCKNAIIVFVTSSKHHALDAYGVSAISYMLKPIKKSDFFALMDKVVLVHNGGKEKFFHISSPQRKVAIIMGQIVMAENVGRIVRIHLENGEQINSTHIRQPFKMAVAELLLDARFLCVHQSYVINLSYVKEMRSKAFVLTNGMEVPIPKQKLSAVKKAYLEFLEENSDQTMSRDGTE